MTFWCESLTARTVAGKNGEMESGRGESESLVLACTREHGEEREKPGLITVLIYAINIPDMTADDWNTCTWETGRKSRSSRSSLDIQGILS